MAEDDCARFWSEEYQRLGRRAIATRTATDDNSYFASGTDDMRLVEAVTQREMDNLRILEIGCGDGRMTVPISMKARHVTGIDISASIAGACEANLRAHGNPRAATVLVGGANAALALEPASYDVAFSHISLQHIACAKELTDYVQRVAALLAPDGVAALQMRRSGARFAAADLARFAVNRFRGHRSFHKCWRGQRWPRSRVLGAVEDSCATRFVETTKGHVWLVMSSPKM